MINGQVPVKPNKSQKPLIFTSPIFVSGYPTHKNKKNSLIGSYSTIQHPLHIQIENFYTVDCRCL